MVGLVVVSSTLVTGIGGGDASASAVSLVSSPTSLVDPFAGTGTGSVSPGNIGEFPGADVPFGMLQWSPDTSPDRVSGSGYSYGDSHISGFSLTHLSGDGCPAYGDVPILPTAGPIGRAPEQTAEAFSHSKESAAPGRYSVTLGRAGVRVALTVTTRTGLAEFEFPKDSSGNVLFKVSDSANPVSSSTVDIVGRDSLTGQVTSGQFCQTGTSYTLYFAAQFDRDFTGEGTWSGSTRTPGSAHCQGSACGAYVTFGASSSSERTVKMKIGISFVSVADAEDNLATEDPGWSLTYVEAQATAQWNRLLDRVRIGGGTRAEQRTFYTALYHSLLAPNVISDDNGDYMGDDHAVHQSDRPQYSDFSEWDIYRSQIELLALVAPKQTGDMMQSLVNDAEQNGWLPKWAIADGDASQMNGDSADPIIASAYAFGVHDFDVQGALSAMVKGATETETGHGLEIERQYLSQYLSQHFIDAGSLDLTSINYSIGGSATLEYALDDFSIAQLARAVGDQSTYTTMMSRAQNWQYLFNPQTGYVEARNADGSFPVGAAFQSDLFEAGGENGFEEGNAIQYTWAVPQDLSALANLMGGAKSAVSKLNNFFTHLNAGRFEPYDWAGNEPSLWTPWEYDYFGAPFRTQDVVRKIVTTLYRDAPVNEPGNDDLGAISSWYVWAAMGLYPVTPGTANLALASPLFPEVSLELPSGRRLELEAPQASASTPYVHSLTVSGSAGKALAASASAFAPACTPGVAGHAAAKRGGGYTWGSPWLPASVLDTGATLQYVLSSSPDRTWGDAPQDAPPSYTTGQLPAVGFSSPSGGTKVQVGRNATVTLGIKKVSVGSPEVLWSASTTPGLTVSPGSGILGSSASTGTANGSGAPNSCASPSAQEVPLSFEATSAGKRSLEISLRTTTGIELPPVFVDITATDPAGP